MNRRAFLASTGILLPSSLAGCLADNPEKHHEDTEQEYQLIPDEVPADRPVQHDITMIQPDIRSSETPLTVELSVSNEADESMIYGERREVLGLYQVDRGFQLLAEDDDRYGFDNDLGLWRTTGPIDITADYQRDELDRSETHSQQLVLIAHNIDESSEVPQEFEFEVTFSAAPEPEQYGASEADYEWGFGLQVEQPDE